MRSENQTPAPVKNRLKSPLLYTSLLMLFAAIYAGWVFLSRHAGNRAYEQRLERQQSQKQREADQTAIEQLGGNELSIQMLYATPEVGRGETHKSALVSPTRNPSNWSRRPVPYGLRTTSVWR